MAKKQKDDGIELPTTQPEVAAPAFEFAPDAGVMAAAIYIYYREGGAARESAIAWAVADAKDLARALAEG